MTNYTAQQQKEREILINQFLTVAERFTEEELLEGINNLSFYPLYEADINPSIVFGAILSKHIKAISELTDNSTYFDTHEDIHTLYINFYTEYNPLKEGYTLIVQFSIFNKKERRQEHQVNYLFLEEASELLKINNLTI